MRIIKRILIIAGVLTIISTLISLPQSFSLWNNGKLAVLIAFLTMLITGFLNSLLFFVVAWLVDSKDEYLYEFEYLKKIMNATKIKCEKCEKIYGSDYSSCPHCGYKK